MTSCKAHAWRLLPAALIIALGASEFASAQSGTSSAPPPPRRGSGSVLGSPSETPEVHGLSLSATDELVTAIHVEGNQTVPAARVLQRMETRVGRPFDPRALSRDIRKLTSLPWFTSVKPLSRSVPGGREIILRVSERAVIRYVEYLGNAQAKDKKLAKETGLKVGAALDPYAVEEGRRRLEQFYTESGFARVQVAVLEGDKPNDKGVIYVINEGVKQKIWSVSFEGNGSDFASARRLKTRVKSKPGPLWLFGGKLNREQLDTDVRALETYYRSFGFFQAKVGRILEFNDEGTWANIRFVIHEGPRYNVRDVRFVGNEKFRSDDLSDGLSLQISQPFEQTKLGADVEWIKEVYGSHGYVFADVRPDLIYLEEPGQLDLVYRIEEGKKWRVGRIFVHIGGENPHTRIQTALNRLSVRPGEYLDIRELRASERRLQASSLFLSEPARGISPRITYQIPELEDTEFTASGTPPQFRGQSPEAGEKSSPWSAIQAAGRRIHEAFKPATGMFLFGDEAASDEAVDIHLVFDPSGEQSNEDEDSEQREHAEESAPVRHTVRKPPTGESIYSRGLDWRQPTASSSAPATRVRSSRPVIRGQSPSPTFAPPTAYAPQGAYPPAQAPPQPQSLPQANGAYAQQAVATQPTYGGTAPRAVSPTAAPAGYAAPAVYTGPQAGQPGAVQQVQFGDPFPTGPTPSAGAPAPRVMGAPYVAPNVDPSVLPIPNNGQLFPGGEFGAPGYGYPDSSVDLHVQLQEAQTGRFMIGAGINSDAGVVGQILIDERNFDWRRFPTSWRDIVNGTAWRGGGQRFRIEAAPGTQVQRYIINWQDPYFRDTPISLSLSGSYFDRRFVDYDEQRIGGRVSTGYQWTDNDLSGSLAYRYESVSIFDAADVPALNEVVGRDNQLHGFGVRIANDTRNNPFLATSGHYVELQLEQVVGTFDYPRAILDMRKYFLINERPDHSGRQVLTASTRLGFSGSNTPVYEHFFAGGFSTLRGFDFRGASPIETTVGGRNVEVGGEFMWISTLEYLFPLTADDAISAVAFVDFGTVEPNVTVNDFRVAPGVGLRLTVPALGPAPIALDFAFPIASADFDDEQVFTFNVGLQR